jgi:hypothetical protein
LRSSLEGTLRNAKGYARLLRALSIFTLVGAFIFMIVHTWRWPLMQDAQVMHYVNFLIDHGFAPYRDIGDLNMPGAYLMERFAMLVFGASDLGYRMYGVFLLVVMLLAMISIARPYDWLAGLFAGVLFATINAADGPKGAGQRDEVMAVLMVVGLAFLFHSVRSKVPQWMALGGFFLGMAAAVKPTIAPLGLVLLILIAFKVRQSTTRTVAFVVYGLLGGAVAAALFFGFLLYYHALGAFIEASRSTTAYYASLNRLRPLNLLRECMPRPMRLLVPFGLALVFINPDRLNWERWALAISLAFAAFSSFIQGKGFYYQRYPLIAMALLWFGIEYCVALRRPGFSRALGICGLAIGIFGLAPLYAEQSRTVFYSNIFTETLEADLRRLGPEHLQRNIQCLDMVDGCMNALYHLNIVQETGMTGDNILFPPNPSLPVVRSFRQAYWESLQAHPPDVFVVSDEQFLDPASFNKLNRWPKFARYLADNYDLYSEHSFPITVAYRIYVRKGSFADPQHADGGG